REARELEGVHADAHVVIVLDRVDAVAVLEGAAAVIQVVAVAVAALRGKAGRADAVGRHALLGAEAREEALEVGVRLGLTGARLEADEVGNRDRGQNADDGNHDHELDEGKAGLLAALRHDDDSLVKDGESPYQQST